MKAIVYKKYGPPEVAKLTEVAKPIPKDNEVLIKVYASTVNRTDAGFRSAEYFISRFWSGLLRPKLLKHFGATVTAVCNTKNVELVKTLGADTVIDYQTQDFTNTGNKYQFIFDAVGKSSFGQCKPLLTDKGIYISTELGKNGENILFALTTSLWGSKNYYFQFHQLQSRM